MVKFWAARHRVEVVKPVSDTRCVSRCATKGSEGDFQHQQIDVPRAIEDRAVTARADALQATEREAIAQLS